jgi:hypothetical protein
MTIDQVFEKATEEQKAAATNDSPFWELEATGWELYLGNGKIGNHRNLFWYNPKTKAMAVDHVRMAYMLTDFISSITPSRLKKKPDSVHAILGQLNTYLLEISRVCKRRGKPSDTALGISTNEVYNDVNELRRRVVNLRFKANKGFEFSPLELAEVYMDIVPKYLPS